MLENISARELFQAHGRPVAPGTFEPARHFYERSLKASAHPEVAKFFGLNREEIVKRYRLRKPLVDAHALTELLSYQPGQFRWSGCDLFHVKPPSGPLDMLVIETNSCPSGNKSMPALPDHDAQRGYKNLMQRSFVPLLSRSDLPGGGLAVVYDKNPMECSGYAAALADATGETVWLAPFPDRGDPPVRFATGVLQVRDEAGQWHPIRAAFRYVTQRPWTRIPTDTRTLIFNPVTACLAGGRNKLVATKAYQRLNASLKSSGLELNVLETVLDLTKEEIPREITRLGGMGVIKIPYGNAGQGVFTITNQRELGEFMSADWPYHRFIVQRLVGNESSPGGFSHLGTLPDAQANRYAMDLRLMISATGDGFRPLAVYARRARSPLSALLTAHSSWDILGTNLSEKSADGGWHTDPDRLMLLDRDNFEQLGITLEDLVDAFVQTVLATVAIDRLACELSTATGAFDLVRFRLLNHDEPFLAELAPLS